MSERGTAGVVPAGPPAILASTARPSHPHGGFARRSWWGPQGRRLRSSTRPVSRVSRRLCVISPPEGTTGAVVLASAVSASLRVRRSVARLALHRQGPGHVHHDSSPVPARRHVARSAPCRLLFGAVLRAHPRPVHLPAPPLVRLVRGQRPRPSDRDPTRTRRAL